MDNDFNIWYKMPVELQIANVGSEVHRAIRWKNKGDDKKKVNFCNKAIEFWEIVKSDPKNIHRKDEFECRIRELRDYLLDNSVCENTDEMLLAYYDSFIDLF